MTAVLWDEWAEMSITHRDVHDADVAAVLHLIQQEAETRPAPQRGTALNEAPSSAPGSRRDPAIFFSATSWRRSEPAQRQPK